MDVVVDADGRLRALAGGAPFNVARTVARLGQECAFVGRLSSDRFGRQLRQALVDAGVRIPVSEPTSLPTTLALAEVDERGNADYRFYQQGTSAAQLTAGDVPDGVLDGCGVLVLGGLGLTLEPTRTTLLELVRMAPPQVHVILDPNCRPRAIDDIDRFRATMRELMRRAQLVKVSTDDLAVLMPDRDPTAAAIDLVRAGADAVFTTDGPEPIRVTTADAIVTVPVPDVTVVDTIGAGDAFVAGLAAWWHRHGRAATDDIRTLVDAATAASAVSAQACTVRGAGLPAAFRWTG